MQNVTISNDGDGLFFHEISNLYRLILIGKMFSKTLPTIICIQKHCQTYIGKGAYKNNQRSNAML